MMNSLEKLILLSLAIIRTVGNRQLSPDEQASRIQKLNAERMDLLHQTDLTDSNNTPADHARIALIQFLGHLAEKKIRSEI